MSTDFAAATERSITTRRARDSRLIHGEAIGPKIEVRRELDDSESRGIAVASVWLIFYLIILVAAATTWLPLVATQLAMR